MKLQLRPMPWLTGIVAVMLAILISLGVWQYQRLQWKTALLAEVEASVTSPPLTSLFDLERAIAAGEPVDFRRIEFEADGVIGQPIYHVFKSQTGGIFWDIFVPLRQSNLTLFAVTATITSDEKSEIGDIASETIVSPWVGYVREDHAMGLIEGWVKSQPNRTTNRWFKFNQDSSWGEGLSGDVRLSHYIEIETNATDAASLPVRRPTIRNNHRDYMLTWFSFAGLLVIFYLLLHRRAGRLSW
jgi:surfeit locus 1 family protein